FDDCWPAWKPSMDALRNTTVVCRSGLPPIRTVMSWPDMAEEMLGDLPTQPVNIYPLTRRFSLTISRATIDAYNFSSGSCEQLGVDPMTHDHATVEKNLPALKASEKLEDIGDSVRTQ
ncbi:hypothetical protein F4781DRAFT_418880, partial [Annulohypoxylon bovei var. microspora]